MAGKAQSGSFSSLEETFAEASKKAGRHPYSVKVRVALGTAQITLRAPFVCVFFFNSLRRATELQNGSQER